MSSCDDYSANLTHFFNITKSFEKNTPISDPIPEESKG